MEAFKQHTGLVGPVDRVNVDTDAIIPKQFLKRIERSGFGQFLFFEWRWDEAGNVIENFPLNQERYQGASVLLSRANFGCGSSREHAPWAIQDFGFRVVIAPSRPRLRLFDQQFLKQSCDRAVDNLTSVVGMETENHEWKVPQRLFEHVGHGVLRDCRNARENFPLRYLVN